MAYSKELSLSLEFGIKVDDIREVLSEIAQIVGFANGS